MDETQVLLGKITALRQRLEQAQGLANEARSAALMLREDTASSLPPLHALERQAVAADHDAQLDHVVRPLTGPPAGDEPKVLPRQLTSRARRVLERGRELLGKLRTLADTYALAAGDAPPDRSDPLAQLYRETAAMADTSLRMIPLFPDTATAQLHLCEGLEATLDAVAARLRTLTAAAEERRREEERITRLSDLLTALAEGRAKDIQPFLALAEEILTEVQDCRPLRFLDGDPNRPAHFAACHGLTVARVMARVVRHDPDLRARQVECVLAALVHDVGMLHVPAAVLAHPGPLDDDMRRAVEAHARAGAALVAPLLPDGAWLAEAAGSHHERLDGTGYPDGLREFNLKPLTRLLAVCDAYVGCCSARPHRPARETRTGLTDVLLMADQGLLDRQYAEALLHLSFYPVGQVVELASGAVGVVVATPDPRRDLNSPARPVVALLNDPQGGPLPGPQCLDLAQCDNQSIVRALPAAERRAVLGTRLAEWM